MQDNSGQMTGKNTIRLVIILLAALLMRIGAGNFVNNQVLLAQKGNYGVPLNKYGVLFPDSVNMYSMAENLANGNGHLDDHDRYAWRMPLYQMFLTGLIKIGLGSAKAIRTVQAFLDVFNCLLLFFIVRRRYGTSAGLFSAFMLAAYPFLVYFSALVLTETMSVTFILLGICCFDRGFVCRPDFPEESFLSLSSQYTFLFFSGVAFGAAGLVKASFAFMSVPFALWVLLFGYGGAFKCRLEKKSDFETSDKPAKKEGESPQPHSEISGSSSRLRFPKMALLPAALLLLGTLVVFAPWWARNYSVFGKFVPFSTMGGYTLFESNSKYADGGPNNGKIVFPEGSDELPELERDRVLKQAALSWIADNPGRFIYLCFRRFVRTWWPVPNYSEASSIIYKLATLGSYVPVMLLALFSIWKTRKNWRVLFPVLLPVLYIALLHSIFMGSIRYRLPVMPCLMIPAGFGAVEIWQTIKRRYFRQKV